MLKLEKTLIYFLIKHNVVIRFRRNLKDHKLGIIRKNVNMKLKRLLKQHSTKNYIKSFNWELTKEGTLFWSNINKKWKYEIKEIQK